MIYQLNYEATHWERGQFIEFISPVRSEMMWSIYEIIHIWTAVVDESEEWSSQLIFQFKQLKRKSLKKSGLQRDSNPWPPRYRCYALPTELWSHTLGARSIYGVLERRSLKKADLQRDSNPWRAILYQLSYEATHRIKVNLLSSYLKPWCFSDFFLIDRWQAREIISGPSTCLLRQRKLKTQLYFYG